MIHLIFNNNISMDIEKGGTSVSSINKKVSTLMVKSNMYGTTLNYMVFRHRVVEKNGKVHEKSEKYKEAVIREICRHVHDTLLNKMLDIDNMVFYCVKTLDSIQFELVYNGEKYEYDVIYDGDVKDNYSFLRCLYRQLLYKSQMIELNDYYINPFDIKETEELSIIPAYRFDYVRLDENNYISIVCDILFSPNVSVRYVIDRMRGRSMSQNDIDSIMKGKIVQTTYQSWGKYYKILGVLYDVDVNEYMITRDGGKRVSLYEYMRHKYPFIEIVHMNQCVVRCECVNNRFESISDGESEYMILSDLLHIIITNEDMVRMFDIDYFTQCKINKRAMRYYYINRFMNSFVDKPQIKNELYKWRINIDRNPVTMGLHPLDFTPTLGMTGPNGVSRIDRNMHDREAGYYENVMENRAHTYIPMKRVTVIFSKDTTEKVQKILFELKGCFHHFKYTEVQLDICMIDDDTVECWKQHMESIKSVEDGSNGGRIILCITRHQEVDYSIRDTMIKMNEIFKVYRLDTTEKVDCFKAHHIILQLDHMIGGIPWIINELNEVNPIVFSSCLYQQLDNNKYLLVFTYSWNRYFNKYLTKMVVIEDIYRDDNIETIKDFYGKCSKQMMVKQGAQSLEYSLVSYIHMKYRDVQYTSDIRHSNNSKHKDRDRLIHLYKSTIEAFNHKSLISIECTIRDDISIYPINRSIDKIDGVKNEYYTDYIQYIDSREYLHNIDIPVCMHMNYNNNNRYLLMSRYRYDDSMNICDDVCIVEYDIFYCTNVKQDNVKKWVMTNTILHGCIDYDNIDKYVCMPVSLLYTMRSYEKLQRYAHNNDNILPYNRYNGMIHLT